jgi:pumilio homology domain family member 6
MLQGFKGSIPKMAVHSVAARVVESLFLEFPAKATMQLKQEFYGPHFSLFVHDIKTMPTLKSSLENTTTDTQKEAALKFVKDIISKATTKGFFGYTFFQELFAEYMDVADSDDIRTMVPSVADHSIHLLSTRAGARVVAACSSYGTPKDRKRICKSLKGYTTSSLLHKDAYLALLRLIQVTDDTVSISKSVLNEILNAPTGEDGEGKPHQLLRLALSEFASKLFLMLLVEDDEARSKYFDPYERSILEAEATVKENGKVVPTSKKDAVLRREELRAHLVESLEKLCTEHTTELLKSLPGSRVLKEFYNWTASKSVASAVIVACQKGLAADSNLFEDVVAHRAIKSMIISDEAREDPVFTAAFFDAFADKLSDVVQSNRGAFVISALLKVQCVKAKASKKLKSMKKQIKDLSEGEGPTAGYEALTKALNS